MCGEFVRVATKAKLPGNGMIAVTVKGENILLARIGDEFFAVSDWCTHVGGRLHLGDLRTDACEVVCPVHLARFNLRTGEPTARPANEPLRTYRVRLEGDDILVAPG